MLKKRIIPCLDVRDGEVVKGVKFSQHRVVGSIIELAKEYCRSGADELVFYDIKASTVGGLVDKSWVEFIAKEIDIPFCVAGGIKSVEDAKTILHLGADKVSINSKALERPNLINEISHAIGSQSVVVGIDSKWVDHDWYVFQYTGSEKTIRSTGKKTVDWVREAQARGAGEIVLNCMDEDGVKGGYDIEQLRTMRRVTSLPLIASGGAGTWEHIRDVFNLANVDGALAASMFHDKILTIPELKAHLVSSQIPVREVT